MPYLQGSPGEVLYRWYADGLSAFDAVCPAAPLVYARLGGKLREALADPARSEDLTNAAKCESRRVNADLAAGRDRLLELHSNRPEVAAALVDAIEEQDAERGLSDYITRFWDAFGVEHDPGPGATLMLRPSAHMRQERFPGLPEDGLTITFNRAVALTHEDREFLTWEHPMTRGAMDLLTSSDLGTCSLSILRDPRLAPGTLLLEMIQVAECPAPPRLEVSRFLPPTALRLVLDTKGRDQAEEISHESLRGRCLTGNRKLASALISSKKSQLEFMIVRGEELATEAAQRLESEARERMQVQMGAELERLRALAKVNPGVRPDELEHLESRREMLSRHLSRVHLRLDALRVIMTA